MESASDRRLPLSGTDFETTASLPLRRSVPLITERRRCSGSSIPRRHSELQTAASLFACLRPCPHPRIVEPYLAPRRRHRRLGLAHPLQAPARRRLHRLAPGRRLRRLPRRRPRRLRLDRPLRQHHRKRLHARRPRLPENKAEPSRKRRPEEHAQPRPEIAVDGQTTPFDVGSVRRNVPHPRRQSSTVHPNRAALLRTGFIVRYSTPGCSSPPPRRIARVGRPALATLTAPPELR